MDRTKEILLIACLALILVATLTLVEIFRELNGFQVIHYRISLPKLSKDMPEKRIVFLSDLHNKEYGTKNSRLIEAIQKQKPDLILVTGDMLVGKRGRSYENAALLMKQLPGIAPVYCVNGNHEQRMKEEPEIYGDLYKKYHKELVDSGVHYLINESAELEWQGRKVVISGFEAPQTCYYRRGRKHLDLEDVEKSMGKAADKACQILLSHHPEYADIYKKWGADLVLSGHLHGGIVQIPGVGGIISPQIGLFPYYSGGVYQEEGSTIVVSRGLGTHTIPLRLFNPAELIVLHVKSK